MSVLDHPHQKAWIEVYPDNGLVTDWYIHSIGEVIAGLGFSVEYVDDCTKVGNRRQDVFFVSIAKSAAILAASGCKHMFFWAQGLAPEEDYLRFNNKFRRQAFAICEKVALSKSDRIFMVSNAMCRFFEEKYGLSLSRKSFIAPCCNEVIHPETFMVPGKYDHPVFTYAGGLSKYQCIDKMLDLFAQIQERIPAAELLFYTWDVDTARGYVSKHGLANVTIESKRQEELSLALGRAKYGFVVRDDIAVNRVATPTKISTYMANGVIPVVSSCVGDFAEFSQRLEHVICCPAGDMVDEIEAMELRNVSAIEMLTEYQLFFDEYFDLRKKGKAIAEFLASSVTCS